MIKQISIINFPTSASELEHSIKCMNSKEKTTETKLYRELNRGSSKFQQMDLLNYMTCGQAPIDFAVKDN